MIQPKLRYLHSPDVTDLKTYVPEDPSCFSLDIQAMIGPADSEGEESFDFTLTTPDFIAQSLMEGDKPIFGYRSLIVARYDYDQFHTFLAEYVLRCGGEDWAEVGKKLSRLGYWEFDEYRSNP